MLNPGVLERIQFSSLVKISPEAAGATMRVLQEGARLSTRSLGHRWLLPVLRVTI